MGIQMRGNGSWTEAATEEREWVWGVTGQTGVKGWR